MEDRTKQIADMIASEHAAIESIEDDIKQLAERIAGLVEGIKSRRERIAQFEKLLKEEESSC